MYDITRVAYSTFTLHTYIHTSIHPSIHPYLEYSTYMCAYNGKSVDNMCKSVVTARIVCSAEGKTHMHGRGKGK